MSEENRRKKVGLALSGAVARGASHLGVLKVLEREGIPVDMIAGTSSGSLVGALYCAGVSTNRMEELLTEFGWGHIANVIWPRRGFITFSRMAIWLAEMIGDIEFGWLPRPLAAVATDLDSGEAVTLTTGRVVPAVVASCSVPGVVEPVRLNGRLLCDGGISNNLPARAARQLGADYVIGVDLFESAIRPALGPIGYGAWAIETLVRHSGCGEEIVDCLITPKLSVFGYTSFRAYKEMIARGERAAEDKVPGIKAALRAQGVVA